MSMSSSLEVKVDIGIVNNEKETFQFSSNSKSKENETSEPEDHFSNKGDGNGENKVENEDNQDRQDQIEERIHYLKIIKTFKKYEKYNLAKLNKKRSYLNSLSPKHQELLEDYKNQLDKVEKCIGENQVLFDHFCEDEYIFENQKDNNLSGYQCPEPTTYDYDKLQAVLKQIVRDWSREGEKERLTCYAPIIEEVERQFSMIKFKTDVRILIPGAGLGRLAHEVVRRGYVVEGNEFSLFMLFASNFILNKCNDTNVYKCYPYVHQVTNVFRTADQTRHASFPDYNPSDLPRNTRFSMTAGDFLEVYGTEDHQNAWDCLVTCFFIDCANNIIEFIERIYSCLKEGGIWINLGPLLYHYADLPYENSIEPSLDIVLKIIEQVGFKIEKQMTLPTHYTENQLSMLNYTYRSAFFVCKKINESSSSSKSSKEEENVENKNNHSN